MNLHRDDELPSVETRRRLLTLQRIFFSCAIALSIISGGGLIRAALFHVIDNRAFAAGVVASTASLPGETKPAGFGAFPAKGPLAKLDIPKIGLSVVVLDGTDAWTLNRAVGHIRGTSYPGSDGNVGIAGHRDGYFKGLRDVHPRDEILLTSPSGAVERYLVDEARIVGPNEVSVLAARRAPSLTLVTCYPFSYVGSAPKRYILTASRMPEVVARPEVPAS